jgi:hypothetical protein
MNADKDMERAGRLLDDCEKTSYHGEIIFDECALRNAITKAFRTIRAEALDEAEMVAKSHTSTNGSCPESIANAEGYRTAVSQIVNEIAKLKGSGEVR